MAHVTARAVRLYLLSNDYFFRGGGVRRYLSKREKILGVNESNLDSGICFWTHYYCLFHAFKNLSIALMLLASHFIVTAPIYIVKSKKKNLHYLKLIMNQQLTSCRGRLDLEPRSFKKV